MEFRGAFKDAVKDWATGQWVISFTCEDEDALYQIDKIKDKNLDIKAIKHREKRSLDSNSYAWVLMQKIAEAVHSDKEQVYLEMLQRYSRAFTHVIVKPQAVDAVRALYRTSIDLGEITVNGQTGHQLQVYFGSSTFDSKEMSVFIDGLVSECKTLGLETLPPDEIARLKASWQSNQP
jgi:hypothetical protein